MWVSATSPGNECHLGVRKRDLGVGKYDLAGGNCDLAGGELPVFPGNVVFSRPHPGHPKAPLTLSLGKAHGSVECDANVGLRDGPGAPRPHQRRLFNWRYTPDGARRVARRAARRAAR